MSSGELHRAVILTAIPPEYQAVRAQLTNLHKEKHKQGTIYQQGNFISENQIWDVIIVETGVGNVFAAVEAERAINHFDPSIVLFVGVAGGLKDVKLGDVVVASQVYAYDFGKAGATYQTRPKVGIPAYSLEQLARAEGREIDWLQRLREPMPNPLPQVFVAPIAAGESVVASTRSSLYQFLRKNYSDAVAVEMEGHGFFHAVHANPRVEALIIRGISDLISNKKRRDAENWQIIAAHHASAFAFEILAKLDASQHLYQVPIVTTSASLKEQPEGESEEQKQTLQEKSGTLPSENTASRALDEFRNAYSDYCNKIRKAFSPFDSGQDIYQDQCASIIGAIINFDKHIKELSSEVNLLNLVIKYDLDNIENAVERLKIELSKFSTLCPPKKTSIELRQYTIEHERIRNKKNDLLEKLEQFKIRLNRQTSLE